MNVVFFSLRTKTAKDEQWWTAMLKKAWKVKKIKPYGKGSLPRISLLLDVVFFSLRTRRRPTWAMMNCKTFKKAWKVKKILTLQPSKLQTRENERCFLLSSYEDGQGWAMMNCNVKKKREKLKMFNLYVSSVFKQPSKLQIVLKMNVVFFSRRRKTAKDEQWWTAMFFNHLDTKNRVKNAI